MGPFVKFTTILYLYRNKIIRALKIEIPAELLDAFQQQYAICSYRERIFCANKLRKRLGDPALAELAISAIRSFRHDEWKSRETQPPVNSAHAEEEPLPSQAYIMSNQAT